MDAMTRPVLLAKPFVRGRSDGFYVLAPFSHDIEPLGPYLTHVEAMNAGRNVAMTYPHLAQHELPPETGEHRDG